MMRATRICAVLFSAVFGLILSTHAVRADQDDHQFGLGVMFGDPTGLSAKLWLGNTHALDMGLAWDFPVYKGGVAATNLHVDYLYHFTGVHVDRGRMPFYVGIGGRILFAGNQNVLGVRIPIGLSYIFPTTPLDIFGEVAPVLDLSPASNVDVNAAVGIRFYF